ncbi:MULTISPECIES: hypothetical protein [Luteimonas]|uniref:hypothetical protein n=1 Tax=Luteimonas TaxID=83614 RepID=UPI000C7D653D|nr:MULTISPECIES: hypothetical protein [Luteimonas]
MHQDTRVISPWSFFLPMLLAVILGNLVVAGVQRLFPGGDEPAAAPERDGPADAMPTSAEPVPPTAPLPVAPAAPPPSDLPVVPPPVPPAADVIDAPAAPDAGSVLDAVAADGATDADGNPRLPGPVEARRSGASRSCINNTVADRNPNGWGQALENDAPVRCSATSP